MLASEKAQIEFYQKIILLLLNRKTDTVLKKRDISQNINYHKEISQ